MNTEEIIKRLREDKYILVTDTCGHGGKLIEFPAIQRLIKDMEEKHE
jgi:hypothetical protein